MNRLLVCVLLVIPTTLRADWRPVTTDVIAAEKPGYGKLCGVLVDPATGEILINLSDKGFYRSTDQGQSWKRAHDALIKGRTEWPGCFQRDPTGKSKKLVAALVYGAPLSISLDDGLTWKATDPKSSHVDWFAIDWQGGEFLVALKHESGDLLIVSNDGGKSYRDLGKGYGPAYIFDDKTAVIAETKTKGRPSPSLLRTTDGAKTLTPIIEANVKAVPRFHNGKLYWLTDKSLIVSDDQAKTWTKASDLKDARYGPLFGRGDDHLFVLANAGILESKDAGKTWSAPIALPKELKAVGPLSWLGYDAANDILYAMKMTSELYQLKRNEK
jgi:photosystem II stability/assembly factor-like uncharacterized protein